MKTAIKRVGVGIEIALVSVHAIFKKNISNKVYSGKDFKQQLAQEAKFCYEFGK